MGATYEDFRKVQEKVAKLDHSRTALCDGKGVPVEEHVEAIAAIDAAIEALKGSVGGKKRKARKLLTKSGAVAKKPGRKPKVKKPALVAAAG